ncbi:MAG: phosphoribosylaminoimidazolesuccinocarboxamide synthase [Gemmatimonadaceae bacterium]|nr:phosphoribosylaminoimidazolesuccinocarboxamide synthase [Gemmatimonadota bacterium]MBP9107610.1 phosphoribosylaminoimidazolesuccinocarboxamide synthase [Gemmatimonadaceae bacterium]
MIGAVIATTTLPLRPHRRGKVRDVYELDDDRLLIVATDRVSAFDVVMRETVPFKGIVLTQLTAWWLRQLEPIVPHHMLGTAIDPIVDEYPALGPHREILRGRIMVSRRTDVFPVECVMRGYLSGSAWKEYLAAGTLAGEALPAGLLESSRLDPSIFSPATKAESGHDENITIGQMASVVGAREAAELERLSRAIYDFACRTAEPRGIIIADTKFEFGRVGGKTILIDEVLTPDSSRFWPADQYAPGRPQPSYDKQPLRDYLDGERKAGRWNGDSPPPDLPEAVVAATSARYLDAFRRITGAPLDATTLP